MGKSFRKKAKVTGFRRYRSESRAGHATHQPERSLPSTGLTGGSPPMLQSGYLRSRSNSGESHNDILRGLPVSWVVDVAEDLRIRPEDMAQRVGLSRSTFHRNRKKPGQRLDQLSSDALFRHRMLFAKATETFDGDTHAAQQWLTTEQMGLGGKIPLDLARTSVGAREVEKLLTRIDRGVYA